MPVRFSSATFVQLVVDDVADKSVYLPLVTSVVDTTTGGTLGDSIKVSLSPLANLVVNTYTDSAVGTPRPKYNRQRLSANSKNIDLDTLVYEQLGINGFDQKDFADGTNYDKYVAEMSASIVKQIDGTIAATFAGITAETVAVAAGDRAETALAVLDAINAAGDPLDEKGITNGFIVAHPSIIRRVASLLENAGFTGDSANLALRENVVGRLYGKVVVKDARVGADSFVVASSEAAVIASRPAGKLQYAKDSHTATDSTGRIALTVTTDFDVTTQEDVITVSTFANVGDLDIANRAVRTTLTFA